MTQVVLGVDLGTTSAKATAFDVRGGEHGGGEARYPLDEPAHGHAVQDPGLVIEATVAAIRQAAASAQAAGAQVCGIALSSAMHSLLALDAHDRPLTPLITWADTRAASQAERLKAEHPELHARTGTPLHPMAPLPKLVWLREHEPAVCAAARRWVGVKELVLRRLAGEWALDHSVASGTGLMASRTLDWDPEALQIAGVRAGQLATLVPAKQCFALTATDLGLPAGVPVIAGAGDGPLANLGVGAVRPGVAACSIGTSGALRVMVEDPRVDPAGRLFCYALTPGRWAVGGAINNGGVVLRWAGEALAPDLGEHAEAQLLALAAEVPAGSEGLIMLPYLLSERAPHWSALPRGAYVGLTRGHHRGHLIRAAVEGVCQQLGLVLASVRDAGFEVRELRATGGFARSDLWRQILTDVLGMPVGFPAGHQGSGFGAALLGMEALGLIDSIERAADLVAIDEELQPGAEAAEAYAELQPVFVSLYDALAPAFRRLRRFDPGSG
ncbi:gluconokinase [Capillimicrobium parvum]|uniref:Xylulose kinase n=1 Tax=Capillimicrobium parvum TaxID=2884022 RepID=A0A9E7BYD5_9ACTN|nr:gluconokinase [Capillimicrobium parvum]UGS34320.1 Xylulose kinase [Capillimicrobium parvum]